VPGADALPHPLPDVLVEQIARRFRVIGEPMRIRLLDRLRDGEASVQELTDALGTTQQNASKHVAVLHDNGIVSRRREGNHVIYAIADDSVLALCEKVCGGIRRQIGVLDELLSEAIS
jgi:DNA-binding transcriptional ArsR family regulator